MTKNKLIFQVALAAALCLLCRLPLVTAHSRMPDNEMRNVCARHWEVLYSNDENGESTFGDKALLRRLAMGGARVQAALYMPDHILALTAHNMNRKGDELCFQSLRSLSHNGTHIDQEEPWLYFMVCTTGDVTERGPAHTSSFRVQIDWFVKELSHTQTPVYSNYLDGSPYDPKAILSLHEAAKHMSLTCGMRDRGFVFPLDSARVDDVTGAVAGQNVNHLGQAYEGDHLTFHPVSYRWLSAVASTGARDNARYQLHGGDKYSHNADRVALDWYADLCWRHVYTNDGNGLPLYGTLSDLTHHVEMGHRVRVRVDDVTMEASNIRVKDGVVAVQLLHAVTEVGGTGPDRHHIAADARARFSIVHSTGKVETHEYQIGGTKRKVLPPSRKIIDWMVDTRPWRMVLQTRDPPGEEVAGSAFELQAAVNDGASIRLNVVLDPLEGSFYTHADNLRVDLMSDVIYAQATDHLSDKKNGDLGEYTFQKDLFRWFLLVSSEGRVRMSAWLYGTDAFKYDESAPEATVTWFANN